MPYQHSFGGGPFDVVVRVSGVLTLPDMLAGRRQILDDPAFAPGLTAVYDYTAADTRNLTGDDMRRYVEQANDARLQFRAVAIVAPDDLTYGFSRMFMSLTEIEGWAGARTAVRSLAEAEAWLQTLDG